jgi:hypothetical protein
MVCWKSTDVSEQYVASILKIEEWAKQETSVKAGGKQSHNTISLSMALQPLLDVGRLFSFLIFLHSR